MTESGPDEALAEAFEEQRGRLVAVAYRMLGSRADAEDAVQEAWLRLARHDAAAIDNLGGWLTTVVGRVCIDVPPERLAFVLHDMFAVPFEEIGQIIGRSPDAAKMLASRAVGRYRTRLVQPMNGSSSARWSMRFSRPRGAETSKGCCGCSTRT
jgi:RNA polymerase sigma-70 factor (ECF subfamily)